MVENRAGVREVAAVVAIHIDEAICEEGDEVKAMEGEMGMEEVTLRERFVVSELGSEVGEMGGSSHGELGKPTPTTNN